MREGKLWARIDGACRPVAIDDAAAGRLEITTCEDVPITCGVTVLVSDTLVPTATWCRRDREFVTGPADDQTLRLVHATDDHAAYTKVVQLTVVPVGLRGEFQQCTSRSLRELERMERLDPVPEPEPTDVASAAPAMEPAIVMGNRTCFFADGFEVAETRSQVPFQLEGSAHIASVPGHFDCTERCASAPQLETYLTHLMEVWGRPFLPPETHGVDLFRTLAACTATIGTPPSAFPADLCRTLGARLR